MTCGIEVIPRININLAKFTKGFRLGKYVTESLSLLCRKQMPHWRSRATRYQISSSVCVENDVIVELCVDKLLGIKICHHDANSSV
jgi:hypothetical protein